MIYRLLFPCLEYFNLDSSTFPIPAFWFVLIQVWNAKDCVVIKRSMATGYAGLDNPVFYKVWF